MRPARDFHVDINSHCRFQVGSLSKAAEEAGLDAVGMFTRPEEIFMAKQAVRVSKQAIVQKTGYKQQFTILIFFFATWPDWFRDKTFFMELTSGE